MYYYNMCGFIFNVMCVMGGVYSKGKINKIEADLSSFIISGGPGLAGLAVGWLTPDDINIISE